MKQELTNILTEALSKLGYSKSVVLEFGCSFFGADTEQSDYDLVIAVV